MRILFIDRRATPPPTDPRLDRFSMWGIEADILRPICFASPKDVEELYGPGSYPVYSAGECRYHWFLWFRYRRWRKFAAVWFYVATGVRIYRERRFDCIVAYAHMMTGLCGAALKALTGAKLIVEVVTAPDRAFLVDRPRPTVADRLKHLVSDACLHFSLWASDRAHLLGPKLLQPYRLLRGVRASVFPEYVPVAAVPRRIGPGQRILAVGAPWHLKGFDLLIAAFRRLEADFPRAELKLVGWFPDRERLAALAGGSPRIEILEPLPNAEVLERMSQASIFALPSRCEGTPCVILEAISAGLPVVASDVGGIPAVVRHGENGFLVPAGEVAPLEARLRELLSDYGLQDRMGAKSYEMARTEFSEQAYAAGFRLMLQETVRGIAGHRLA